MLYFHSHCPQRISRCMFSHKRHLISHCHDIHTTHILVEHTKGLKQSNLSTFYGQRDFDPESPLNWRAPPLHPSSIPSTPPRPNPSERRSVGLPDPARVHRRKSATRPTVLAHRIIYPFHSSRACRDSRMTAPRGVISFNEAWEGTETVRVHMRKPGTVTGDSPSSTSHPHHPPSSAGRSPRSHPSTPPLCPH